jgi:hypothetical protein
MWPDHEDVARVLKTIPSPKPSAESIYQDAALVRLLLFEASRACRNHGRHQFQNIEDIKKFVEDFLGHAIDDHALMVGIRMNGIQTKTSSTDKSVLLVKMPPLERFEEVRDRWKQRQVAEQKQIDDEVQRWAAFRECLSRGNLSALRVLYES